MPNQKYRLIFERLQKDISSGYYAPGKRLPSETELVRRFEASRMTVFRAMRELQSLGLITRRVGSGTFVSTNSNKESRVFGLLIPELGETEIFEAICKGMMEAQEAMHHSLLWGNTVAQEQDKERAAQALCENYISSKVSGVFFAPVEFSTNRHQANHRIVAALDKAGIPVVLLDRCLEPYPQRSKYDLVGIDNRRTGYLATEHLIKAGAKRIAFIARPNSAPTVDARMAGYREALLLQGAKTRANLVNIGDVTDARFIKSIIRKQKPDAFVCANDLTAGNLMHTVQALGLRIPDDVRIVGIDDVKYSRLLPVPLTTLHQPCREIGRIAITVMLDRIANPDLPARDVLLSCDLIIRKSSVLRHSSAKD
jgi:DNA-binding LacI/PurR family transcriptional regulator